MRVTGAASIPLYQPMRPRLSPAAHAMPAAGAETVPGRPHIAGADTVELSAYAASLVGTPFLSAGSGPGVARVPDGEEEDSGAGREGRDDAAGPDESAEGGGLTEEELREVRQLASRDREVRAHEQAHKAVGGQYAGGVSYEFQVGPDRVRYAVGGEVSIDVSRESDPRATVMKMRQVRAAALAPAEPSPQDRSVAARATQLESQASLELLRGAAGDRGGPVTDGASAEEAPAGSGVLVDVTV